MLSAPKLANALLKLSSAPVSDVQEMGKRWATAYRSYALDARSPLQSPPTITGAAQRLLGIGMAQAFRAPSPPAVAAAMAQALTAFWLAPPIAFPNAFPGVVTLVPGAVALPQALVSAWAANFASRASNEGATKAVATVLDAFTRTVIVTHATTPVPTIGPIT